jgi:cobalt-zinc-cadmium efflux system membrane fusion protein
MTRLALLSILLTVGCAPSAGDAAERAHDDHEHEHVHKTDAHHVAENRQGCEDDVSLPQDALERYGIEVAPAREMALTPTISAPGHLAFPQGAVARIGSAVVGRIVDVRARSGDEVAIGDVLLVVESPELGEAQSEYLQKRAAASTAGPALEIARSSHERAKELHERNQGISLAEVQRREGELRQAERDLEVSRSAEAAARNRLLLLGVKEAAIGRLEQTGKVDPRSSIASPIAGRVVEVAATLGELVDPSKDRLLVVGDLSVLWAIAEVSESRLAEVAIGAAARVRIPALGREDREGRVDAVPVVLEPSTRTAEVRVEVANADGAMLPGMFIQVEIESSRGTGQPILVVPDGAVLTIRGRPSVFVPLEPGSSVFCRHEVRIGTPVKDSVPVLEGLKAGELLVVAGAFRLKAEHEKASAKHEH